jgi:hypothetical protein
LRQYVIYLFFETILKQNKKFHFEEQSAERWKNFHKVRNKMKDKPRNIQRFSVFLFLISNSEFFIGMAKSIFTVSFILFENAF